MMELKISRTELGRAMKIAARVVDKSSKVPLAACVLVRSDGMATTINAVGLDVTMSAQVTCATSGKGSAAINAAELSRIASDVPSEDITAKVGDDGWTEIRSGKARYKLAHLSGRDYPALNETGAKWVSVDAAQLSEAMRRGAFCPCTEGDRGWMMGALFDTETEPGVLICASSDGKRLAFHRVNLLLPSIRKAVPARWAELARVVAANAEKIEVSIETKVKHRIYLRAGGITMSSGWLHDEPASAASLAPFLNTTRGVAITANRERLVAAVKRLAAIADECHGVTITTRSGAIALSVRDASGREIDDEIECEVHGEIEFGINARYLSDCLGVMTGDAAELRMSGPLDPVAILDSGDAGFTGIVMPMRI